jgi:hypothetical protein
MSGPQTASGGAPGRAIPIYCCPFCGEEDVRPDEAAADAWACSSCARRFSVRLLGLDEEGIPGRVDPSSVGGGA